MSDKARDTTSSDKHHLIKQMILLPLIKLVILHHLIKIKYQVIKPIVIKYLKKEPPVKVLQKDPSSDGVSSESPAEGLSSDGASSETQDKVSSKVLPSNSTKGEITIEEAKERVELTISFGQLNKLIFVSGTIVLCSFV